MARSMVEWLGFVRAVYTRPDGTPLPSADTIKRADEADAVPVVLPFCDAWTRMSPPPRSADDYKSMLRHVMEVIEEHEAHRDDVSAEKLFRTVPWIREALS